jgi:hypothetical protein
LMSDFGCWISVYSEIQHPKSDIKWPLSIFTHVAADLSAVN